MSNVLDLKEFKQVLKEEYEDISDRVEYIINDLFDDELNYVFESFDVVESFYELEPLAPKNQKNVVKLRLTDHSKQNFDELVSLYVEINDYTDKENYHGSKKEGLALNFYNDESDVVHQINHIFFKEQGRLYDLVNKFKLKYGNNMITHLPLDYKFKSISLSKN